jgi:hypothetical protein
MRCEAKEHLTRSSPVFADPNTDFVFYLIFGSEDHKKALLGFSPTYMQVDCVPNQ